MADYTLSDTYNGVQKVMTYPNGPKLRIREGNVPFYVPPPFRAKLRFQFANSSFNPNNVSGWVAGSRWEQVSSSPNVWDYSRVTTSFAQEFKNKSFGRATDQAQVISGDLTDVTDISEMFKGTKLTSFVVSNTDSLTNCSGAFYETSLTSCPDIDTSDVTDFSYMFDGCESLTSVRLYDTGSAVNVSNMFRGALLVASGALSLYNQMSGQTTPPVTYTDCFSYCGSNTTTGRADLAEIPQEWGGTKPPLMYFDSVNVHYTVNTQTQLQIVVGNFKLGSTSGTNVTATSGSYTDEWGGGVMGSQLTVLSNGLPSGITCGSCVVNLAITDNSQPLYSSFGWWNPPSPGYTCQIRAYAVVNGVETTSLGYYSYQLDMPSGTNVSFRLI